MYGSSKVSENPDQIAAPKASTKETDQVIVPEVKDQVKSPMVKSIEKTQAIEDNKTNVEKKTATSKDD